MAAIFGHYLTPEGLQQIKNYKYQSGEYTFLDNLLNHFWNVCVEFVPMTLAANVLTLFGFLASWIAFITMMYYAPNCTEEIPPLACVVVAVSVFVYQTLDAIDGKQARRTGSSSPLGTLFDHGCDIVTGTILAISVVALCRTGPSNWTFAVMVISSQLMQFIYLWWEYHFHVFFSNPGYGTGVTEAQLGIMFFALLTATFGSQMWYWELSQIVPLALHKFLAPILSYRLNDAVLLVILINNAVAAIYIVVSGLAKLSGKQRRKGLIQTSSYCGFLIFEWFFYHSTILRLKLFPPLMFFVMSAAYSTINLRILLSSTSRRYYHSLQWPATPFCVIAAFLFLAPYVSTSLATWVDSHALHLVIADLVWQVCYLADLLTTSIDDICTHLNIHCFSIKKPLKTE